MSDSEDYSQGTPPTPEAFAAMLKQQSVLQALGQPHQLFLADTVLKVKVDGGTTTLSLGATTVAGVLNPLFSVVVSTRFAMELSIALYSGVQEAAAKIREDAAFVDQYLPKP